MPDEERGHDWSVFMPAADLVRACNRCGRVEFYLHTPRGEGASSLYAWRPRQDPKWTTPTDFPGDGSCREGEPPCPGP